MRGNEIAVRLARSGSAQRFVGPEPSFGGLQAGYKKKDETLDGETASGSVGWSCSTQRQARELISDPNLATGAR